MNFIDVKIRLVLKMTISVKPTLYNGFKADGDLAVLGYVERVFFTEVYRLSDGRYLYLFTKLDPDSVVDRGGKYNVVVIKDGSKSYTSVVVDAHSKDNVFSIFDDLASVKGLECVAGMNKLKAMLVSDVINPLKNPAKFERFKVTIPNGIILYGPPGCGKTFIVRKLAEELGYNFFDVKHSDLATPYIHGSVGNIGKVFSVAHENAPAILFFDEISGLVPDRATMGSFGGGYKEEEIDEFLMQLDDAADKNVLVVGATNYIDRVDPAVLRPGRFDKKIHVPLPDFEARESLFRIGLVGRPSDEHIDFGRLATLTDGFSCADIIESVVESAARFAANHDLDKIDQKLLENEIVMIPRQKTRRGHDPI